MFRYSVCTCKVLLLPLGHRLLEASERWELGGWGANARDVLRGGGVFIFQLGWEEQGMGSPGKPGVSSALPRAWPLPHHSSLATAPKPMGLHIPPFSSSFSCSPMSLAGSPHSCSLAPWGVPKHCQGLRNSRWLWQRGT